MDLLFSWNTNKKLFGDINLFNISNVKGVRGRFRQEIMIYAHIQDRISDMAYLHKTRMEIMTTCENSMRNLQFIVKEMIKEEIWGSLIYCYWFKTFSDQYVRKLTNGDSAYT